MKIVPTKTDSALAVSLEGRLDTATAPELDAFLAGNLEGITALTFDLEKLEYISSAGLRSLLSAQKKMARQGGMTVRNPNEIVQEIFDITGFSDMLTIE